MLRPITIILLLTVNLAASSSVNNSNNEIQEGRAKKKDVQYKSKIMVGDDGRLDSYEKENLSLEASPKEKIKIKLKKKEKKFLKEFFLASMLVKAAILPLALGFVKLLTGKALLITMMAFGFVTLLTFSSAGEHKSSTTEVINLLGPNGHSRSIRSVPEHILNQRTFQKYD